ncbi:MAG TPA: LysR family transcriptional regulator [Burkholderiales bacterium]|nr:LysR family transcriptional regulator [Burkholderiales bacterium]
MPRITQWERHVGRRLRLRDLFVFFTVVDCGSMAKAAAQLGVSTPSISGLIGGLEDALGVRLLDRSSKGVVTTRYGHALLARGRAAFDELRQGIRDIESISDPAAGEVRIGCPESVQAFLLLVIESIARRYPRMRFEIQQVHAPTVEFPELRERKIDLVLARLIKPPVAGRLDDEFDAEVLLDDPFSAAVGPSSKWARRRKIDLAELVDEPWALTRLDVLAGWFLADAFEARGLKPPVPAVATFSTHVRSSLASRGPYIAVLPESVLRFSAERFGLVKLPIRLSSRPSPVAIVTLRGRTLTPAVRVFVESAREVAASLPGSPKTTRRRSSL